MDEQFYVSKDVLVALLNEAYEAGMYGYSELQEATVEGLVEEFIKNLPSEEKAIPTQSQGYVSVASTPYTQSEGGLGYAVGGWSTGTATVSVQGGFAGLPSQQQQPSSYYGASSISSASGAAAPMGTSTPEWLRSTHPVGTGGPGYAGASGGYFGGPEPVPVAEHNETPERLRGINVVGSSGHRIEMVDMALENTSNDVADLVMRPAEEAQVSMASGHRNADGSVTTRDGNGETTIRADGTYSWRPYAVGQYPQSLQTSTRPEPTTPAGYDSLTVYGDG